MMGKGLPKYLQLKRELMRKIKSLRSGDRVDSEHELVAKYSVSRATVAKAIGELVAEGFLYREQGRGTFVADVEGRADGALGFIYYTWHSGLSASSWFGAIFAGVEDAARSAGRDILFMAGKNAPGEEFQPPSPAELARKGVAGLLSIGIDSDDHLADLMASGLPLVSVDYYTPRLEVDAVIGDSEAGGFEGTRHLMAKGHRRIAFLGHTRHGSRAYQAPDQGSLERLKGYRRAHAEAGLGVEEELVLQPRQQELSFVQHLEKLAAEDRPPTAVFCTNSGEQYEEVLDWAGRRNLPLEGVAADFLPVAEPWRPPSMRACEDPREMGRAATRLLLERIAGGPGPARRVVVPTKLINVRDERAESAVNSPDGKQVTE